MSHVIIGHLLISGVVYLMIDDLRIKELVDYSMILSTLIKLIYSSSNPKQVVINSDLK